MLKLACVGFAALRVAGFAPRAPSPLQGVNRYYGKGFTCEPSRVAPLFGPHRTPTPSSIAIGVGRRGGASAASASFASSALAASSRRDARLQAMGRSGTFKSSPRYIVGLGMAQFREGGVQESLDTFNQAIALDASLRPYLWQRGISLYYAGSYEEGAAQFRGDVAANPNDTEEAIWAMLCEARMESLGFEAARRRIVRVSGGCGGGGGNLTAGAPVALRDHHWGECETLRPRGFMRLVFQL